MNLMKNKKLCRLITLNSIKIAMTENCDTNYLTTGFVIYTY